MKKSLSHGLLARWNRDLNCSIFDVFYFLCLINYKSQDFQLFPKGVVLSCPKENNRILIIKNVVYPDFYSCF